ncbi:MAG: flagellar motor protein MotD [Betaproteobacteria bacterium]|nr:flagellar motor protein MotD [Betaproteobacteria bacterium]
MRRRHPSVEDDEKPDRWLVSYADFITLLFAFFVVMYAISQVNEGKYRVLSESLSTAFTQQIHLTAPPRGTPVMATPPATSAPEPPAPEPPEPSALPAPEPTTNEIVGKELLEALNPMVARGLAKVQQTERGISVDISASALFDIGQADLQPAAVPALRAAARVLAKVPNRIQVEGHTDNVPISTVAYPSNWELSSARAASVVRMFIGEGVPAARLAAVGYAEHQPIEGNTSAQGRASNRRVTVILMAAKSEDKDGLTLTLNPKRLEP